MNDSIYTIPISEVFEEKSGCPICRMHDTLEERSISYIMGAAMMEPDVRIETNRLGFCSRHFEQMLRARNRLALALVMQSHLAEIKKNILNGKTSFFTRDAKVKKMVKLQESCFVCEKIDWALERMFETVFKLYETESAFRALYREQETLCLRHYQTLCTLAETRLSKPRRAEFLKTSTELVTRYLDTLYEDVSHFCRMYDYRNAGPDADWGNAKDSVERAVWFLTSDHL